MWSLSRKAHFGLRYDDTAVTHDITHGVRQRLRLSHVNETFLYQCSSSSLCWDDFEAIGSGFSRSSERPLRALIFLNVADRDRQGRLRLARVDEARSLAKLCRDDTSPSAFWVFFLLSFLKFFLLICFVCGKAKALISRPKSSSARSRRSSLAVRTRKLTILIFKVSAFART